jgi:hypothetical protein
VGETKDNGDYSKLSALEADKINIGKKHFEIWNISFDAVVRAIDLAEREVQCIRKLLK